MRSASGAPSELSAPQLLFELARGGMGTVHLARVAGIGGFERFVVVKRILDANSEDEETLTRFLTEARVAARIHHANVVGTHHVGTDERGLYMVLDYIEGSSLAGLADRVALRGETIPIPLILRIALDALAGLGAVHRATGNDGAPLGIVHRDVSLQNVLVGRDGIARLADFGIAKSESSAKTKTGSLTGKLLYLPPEYIRQEPIDATADIYMLGVTLWCALTSEEPWRAKDAAQMMHRILTEPVPSLASVRKEPVAPELEALVCKACDPVPGERFQSAEEMTLAIEKLGRERGWVASQRDVAAFVESLLGVDLDRRRQRIAQIVSGDGAAANEDSLSVEQRGALAGPKTSAILPAKKGSARDNRLYWALAAVLLAAAVISLFQTRDVTSMAQPEGPAPATSPSEQMNAVGKPQQGAGTTSMERALGALPPLPSSAASAAASNRASSPSKPRRMSKTPVRSPAPPDEISTRNPYR